MGISDRAALICNFLMRVMAYQLKQVHNCPINLSTVITLGTINYILYRNRKLQWTTSNHYLGFWLSTTNYQPLIVLVGEGIFQTFRNTRTQICGVTSKKLPTNQLPFSLHLTHTYNDLKHFQCSAHSIVKIWRRRNFLALYNSNCKHQI